MRSAGPRSGRWPAGAVGALVVTIGVTFWQLRIVGHITLPQDVGRWNADLYTIYYQVYRFAYADGELLPRWNPYQLAGTPFIANYNGGLLYPPNLLATLVPVRLAMGWSAAFHLALAGTFVLLAARALALAWPAAALAAACFMLNGYFVVEHFRISYLAGLAWVPAVLLCGARVLAHPTPARGVVLGVAVACQLLTGHAQMVCYTGYAMLLAGATYLLIGGEGTARDLGRTLVALAIAAVMAALLAAAQLLPTFELVRNATRGLGGLTLQQTQPWTPSLELLRQVVLG